MEAENINKPQSPALQQGDVMRRFKELFNSRLKCERIGHDMKEEQIKVRKSSYEWREVVADFKATRCKCKRCGETTEPTIGEKVDWYSSCSMPDSMWAEIKEKGYLVL